MANTPKVLPKNQKLRPSNKQIKPYLVCDNCGYYPLTPMHGHYVCGACKMPTKCCEGAPLKEE